MNTRAFVAAKIAEIDTLYDGAAAKMAAFMCRNGHNLQPHPQPWYRLLYWRFRGYGYRIARAWRVLRGTDWSDD